MVENLVSLFGIIAILLGVLLLGLLIVYLQQSYTTYVIAKKTQTKYPWIAWIPYAQSYFIFWIGRAPMIWFWLAVVGALSGGVVAAIEDALYSAELYTGYVFTIISTLCYTASFVGMIGGYSHLIKARNHPRTPYFVAWAIPAALGTVSFLVFLYAAFQGSLELAKWSLAISLCWFAITYVAVTIGLHLLASVDYPVRKDNAVVNVQVPYSAFGTVLTIVLVLGTLALIGLMVYGFSVTDVADILAAFA